MKFQLNQKQGKARKEKSREKRKKEEVGLVIERQESIKIPDIAMKTIKLCLGDSAFATAK